VRTPDHHPQRPLPFSSAESPRVCRRSRRSRTRWSRRAWT
jgi:hypothetical protein